jgi:sugar lactone lactonase YvrE
MPELPRFGYTISPKTVYITRDPLNASIARLDIGVTNATGSFIECDQTSFVIQIGDGPGALTSDPGSIVTSSSRRNDWSFTKIEGAPGQFRAEPIWPNRGLGPGDSVSFQLANIIVNGELGSTAFEIIEMTDDRREEIQYLNKSLSDLRIDYFTVTPNSIKPGEYATLKWKTQSAASCTMTRAGYPPVAVGVTDSMQVRPDDSATYTLDASGVGQVQASRLVSVIRVKILEFRGPTLRIPPDSKAPLWWRTEFATRCELMANGEMVDPAAPLQAEATPYWVYPKKDPTLYTLFAYDAEGNYDHDYVTVFLQPRFRLSLRDTWKEGIPPKISYIATPSSLKKDTRIFVSSINGRFCVLDSSTRKMIYSRDTGQYYFLEPSPDGKKLFAEYMLGVYMLDATPGSNYPKLAQRTDEFLATGAAFHPDGSKVYLACGGPPTAMDIMPEAEEAASVSATPIKGLVCSNAADLSLVYTMPLGQIPGGTSISPDGKTLCLVEMKSGLLYLINLATKEVTTIAIGSFSGAPRIVNSVWSPDGKKVYATNCTPGTVWVVTLATKAVSKINLGADVTPALLRLGPAVPGFEEGSNVLYALCAPDGTVAGISTTTDQVLSRVSLNQQLNPAFAFVFDPQRLGNWAVLAIAPDGKSIYVSDPTNNSIFIVDNGYIQKEAHSEESAELTQTVFDYVVTPKSVYITRDPHNPSIAKFDIGVTNNTGSDFECDWISFIVIPGEGPGALTADPGSISPSSSRPDEWSITSIQGAPGQFRAEPVFPNTGLRAGDSISFQVADIVINGELGASNFDIAERVGETRGKSYGINKIRGDLNIDYFRAQPPDIKPGSMAKLTWKTVGAASCILSWPTGSEEVSVTGSKDVQPSDTRIYTLTAHGGLGPDVSAQTAIVVNKVIIFFDTDPIAVGLDGSSMLTWQVLNADPDTYRLNPGDFPIAPVGEKLVTLNKTTPYTISARGGNSPEFKQVIISVEYPVIRRFHATTPEKPGAPVTLSWDTQYAKSVSIDQGVGQVPPVGSTVVSNLNQTTYTLTCLGLGEPVKGQVTVPGNAVRILYVSNKCIDTEYSCNNRFFGVHCACVWQTEFATSTRLIRVSDNAVVATQSGEYRYYSWAPAANPEVEYKLVAEGPGGPAVRKILLGWWPPSS